MKKISFILAFLPLVVTGIRPEALPIFSPKAGSNWALGRTYKIQWNKALTMKADVAICLLLDSVKIAGIVERTPNSGIFAWKIPETQKPGSYRIRIETTDHSAPSDSGVFQIVPLPSRSINAAKPIVLSQKIRDILLNPTRLPPNVIKPDFSKMEFDFIDSHYSKSNLPKWFILKYQGKNDKRYFKYVFRLRDNLDYRIFYKYKDSPDAKEVTIEKKIVRQLKFSAPKYATASYRRDAFERIIQLLTYRRYLVANGYFESGWDRVVDFFTDVGNLFDLVMTITEVVFGDVDYARIANLAKHFYQDCIDVPNESLYDRCTDLWYEINDLINEHFEEVQFDYFGKVDGIFNRISTVQYIDLKQGLLIAI